MRKNALTITLTTLVLSIFGAFLRWLQTRTAMEKETGLAIPGAPMSIVYVIYTVLALGVIAVIVFVWLKRLTASKEPGEALNSGSVIPTVLLWVFCGVFICASLAVLFTAAGAKYPLLQRLLGAFGIFAGLCFPFLTARDGKVSGAARTAAVFLPLFCCFMLVFFYKLHAENPIVWAYGPDMIALAATALAVYEIAAYYFDRAKPLRALLMVQYAALLDISVIFDERAGALTAMLVVFAFVMLLTEYLLLTNMKD